MATQFSEERFDDEVVTLNMSAGATFSTNIVTVNGGFEQRQSNWQYARGRYEVGNRAVSELEFHNLKSFFLSRRGRFQGFRLKDWTDYKVNQINGYLGSGVYLEGVIEYQLNKRYFSGGEFYERKIAKPVHNTIQIFVNSIEYPVNTGLPGSFNIDFTTGISTFVGDPLLFLSPGDELRWTGEFDVPVRFDVDTFQHTLGAVIHPTPNASRESQSYVELSSIPCVELKL